MQWRSRLVVRTAQP